jgi:hypothetical protein
MPNLINKSDDPRKDWAKVNLLAAQVDDLRKQIGLQREYITTLRKNLGSLAAGMHPFKVYQIPPHLRASTSAEDWRKVRVRSGRALGVDIVTGTDGATEVDEGGFPSTTDITVPASSDNYTIYLTLSSSAVSHSDTPPAESEDVLYIAVCDSDTRSAQKELVIRQLVRTDILSTGGGGAPGRYRVKSIQNQYLLCVRWDGTTEGTTYYNIARPYIRPNRSTAARAGRRGMVPQARRGALPARSHDPRFAALLPRARAVADHAGRL